MRATLLALVLAFGCAEPEPFTFDFADNPCDLDRPTRLSDSLSVGGLIEFGDDHGTMLSWIPSDVPRHGFADAVVAERFDLCGRTESVPAEMPLRPVGRGGYSCSVLGLHWTDDLADDPVHLRRTPTDCRGVVVTDEGLFIAEEGTLWRYRSPDGTPEAVVSDIDTETLYGRVYSDTVGWPLALHGDDLFYLATGGVVRSVDLETGLRSLVADEARALYGHPDKPYVVWEKTAGSIERATVYFPAERQAVQIPGAVHSIARFDDWIVTRDGERVGLYRPDTNDLRVFSSLGSPWLVRIDGDWAYFVDTEIGAELLSSIVAMNLASGETRTLLTRPRHYMGARDNPYGEGVLAFTQPDDNPDGEVLLVDLDGVHEIVQGVHEPYFVLGDGAVLYQRYEADGNVSLRYRSPRGDDRLVAWNAIVASAPVEHLHGDALFFVGPGEHGGLWRMPAIP